MNHDKPNTAGITIGLPNSSNKGFDIKAGMIDSNAPYANDIKLYDSNDKGAMSMSFAICDIECKEILEHSKDGRMLKDYIYYTPNHYCDFIHLIPK